MLPALPGQRQSGTGQATAETEAHLEEKRNKDKQAPYQAGTTLIRHDNELAMTLAWKTVSYCSLSGTFNRPFML